jgi:putative aldouronate transport system substrate-binding protein
MKIKLRKSLLLLSVSAMTFGVLGCTSTNSGTGKQASPDPVESPKAAASSFPLKEKATIEVFNSSHDTKPVIGTEPIFAELEKRTNIHLKLINVPTSSYADKFKVTLASGKLPDTIESDVSSANKYGMDGAFMPLDDLLKKFGPNILRSIKDTGLDTSLRAVDGKIYGIPLYTSSIPDVPMYRQDWLDQLKLKAPQSPEGFYQVLKAFKDNQLGGKDTVPYAPLGYNNFPIFKAFGTDFRMFLNDGGQYQFGPALPGMKDALTFLNRLYNEKLIDPEFAIISKQQWEAKVSTGKVGSVYYNPGRTDFFTNTLQKENPKAKMIGYGALKNKNGKGDLQPINPLKGVMVISSQSKNAEVVIKFFDFINSPEGQLLTQYGIEGTSYTMKDGKPQYSDEFKKNVAESTSALGISTAHYLFSEPLPSLFKDRNEGTLLAAAVEAAKPDMTLPAPILSFTQEDQDIISKDLQPIMDKTNEYMIKFIIGQEPLSNFDKYVDELKQRGLDELVKTYNTAYQRVLKGAK